MNFIKTVLATGNWELIYSLENGEERAFDVKPYLNDEAFQDLNDLSQFSKINNGRYFVEWECGADLSIDTLNTHSTVLKQARLVA
jgi:Protein of unknown function (DUF2442)